MRTLDLSTWERREIYTFFSQMTQPFYMVTFRVDVTPLYLAAKRDGLSFYKGMIWACTQAINQVEAFQITAREGKLYVLDQRRPSFTDMKAGSQLFHIVTVEPMDDIHTFCAEAGRQSAAQDTFIVASEEADDLIYFSCLPWVDLTALTNERDLSSPDALNDNIPRIAWGKYVEEGGRKKLAISVEVNHRFIDGVHIGQFAQALEQQIADLAGGNGRG